MNCKFCNEPLPEEVTLCPACGKENAEEVTEEAIVPETEETVQEALEETAGETVEVSAKEESAEAPAKPKRSLWVTVVAIVGGIALLAVLVCAVLYGMNAGKIKTESYTVSDAKAQRERDTVVAVVGDRELTNSELQVYYWQGVNEFYNYITYYMDAGSLGLDLSQPLDQQFYDEANGVTWQQYFVDMAVDTWHRYAALGELAESEGFTLNEEAQAYLSTVTEELETMAVSYGYESAADMLSKDMGPACDVEGYRRYVELNFYVGQYFNTVYDRLEPSMEELEQYYQENEDALNAMGIENDGSRYVNARHILIHPTGGTLNEETGNLEYSQAEWETCRQQAQDLLDQWQAGDRTEDSFAALAMEYTQDTGSQSTGGLYTNIPKGRMVAPFEEWCFDESRVYGDTGLVQTNYGYHIMYFVSSEPVWASELRSQLVNERSTELVTETVENTPVELFKQKIVLGQTGIGEE